MCRLLLRATSDQNDFEKFKEGVDSMKHGGPDHTEIKQVHNTGAGNRLVFMGHNRLSIIDPSESSNQPLWSDGSYLLFNGEIYNYRELIKEYELNVETEGDGEVILKMYQLFRKEAFQKLDGEYAIVIYDTRENEIIMTRDPIGIKPLYVRTPWNDHTLTVASEIKGLLPFLDNPVMDPVTRADLLTFGYPIASSTSFRNIESIQPGAVMTYDIIRGYCTNHNTLEDKRCVDTLYQNRSYIPKYKEDVDPAKRVHAAVENAVKKRMISDVPISVTLSGGVDSAIVAGIMAKYHNGPVKAYTIGFEGIDHEFEQAIKVAEHIGAEHKIIKLNPEQVIEDIDKIIWHLEDPMDRGSSMYTYYLGSVIEEKVTLIGEGADECFGGYRRHQSELPQSFEEYTKEFLKVFDSNIGVDLHGRRFYDPEDPNSILTIDLLNEIPQYHTMRIDKLMMAHAVEARVPYLDPEVVKVALSVPYRFKKDPAKKVLREAFKEDFPDWMLNPEKKALKLPYDQFVKMDAVKGTIYSYPHLPISAIDELYSQGDDPPRNWGRKLWQLYLITKWYELFTRR